jgi:hypothetical protein
VQLLCDCCGQQRALVQHHPGHQHACVADALKNNLPSTFIQARLLRHNYPLLAACMCMFWAGYGTHSSCHHVPQLRYVGQQSCYATLPVHMLPGTGRCAGSVTDSWHARNSLLGCYLGSISQPLAPMAWVLKTLAEATINLTEFRPCTCLWPMPECPQRTSHRGCGYWAIPMPNCQQASASARTCRTAQSRPPSCCHQRK